ncbi:cytochrome-c peroxidase [Chryseolinea lacunae]|uniref:C-type cytochrome n=1 Tax=Chryseolinea lacunae TaxID=2801331 RepID=A0ABS1KMW7_9BACT|nr:cytochrome c peroxidase [Chryseolinea lacunae]MBL0740678.1 c-type cytochrome [Chryseolinea lacunae]
MRTAIVFIIGLFLFGCGSEGISPADTAYVFQQPSNFPPATYTFENNPVTKDRFELGRALFYDPVLSADSTIACANCHQQVRSFSDPVHKFSKGVNDVSGFRNAPAIQNMAFQAHFFWDGGVNHLDFVPINAITSEIEMAESLSHVVTKLSRSDVYREKFENAFGTGEVSSQKMLYALSQFMNMMISADSRYDRYIRHEGETLTADEAAGMKLFATKCSTCHATDMFTDGTFRNNGLNETFAQDSGRARVTESADDRGKFKVPSLRNAELTFPYMHDGRFRTLQEVLNHYAHSVKESETLDPALKQNGALGIVMTDDEKAKIILYIKTLTDRNFTNDKRFSNPFLN